MGTEGVTELSIELLGGRAQDVFWSVLPFVFSSVAGVFDTSAERSAKGEEDDTAIARS